MSIRKNNKSQALAAAKAGISERSARRIESSTALPSQSPRRYWRSRVDPFAQVWDTEVVPLLRGAPKLMAITLLRKLQDDHPELFPDGVQRTLQRHIRQWRALEGPPKEVFFPQDHAPGHRGLSDFTAMGELRITIANAPFAHILYHFVLAFSRWEHVEVVEGGESFEALSKGLQNSWSSLHGAYHVNVKRIGGADRDARALSRYIVAQYCGDQKALVRISQSRAAAYPSAVCARSCCAC